MQQRGHVSSEQSSEDAATRETFEEIGLKIKKEDLKYLLTYNEVFRFDNDANIYKEIFDCYIINVKEINMNDIVLQESEVADAKLVTKDKFKSMVESGNMVERSKFYKAILDYLF